MAAVKLIYSKPGNTPEQDATDKATLVAFLNAEEIPIVSEEDEFGFLSVDAEHEAFIQANYVLP